MASYILSYSKRIVNSYLLKMGADKSRMVYYMDTDSMYIHIKDFNEHLSDVKD